MTSLGRFQAEHPALAERLGLSPGPATSEYLCTPRNARVLAWAGVDGIHFCTVGGMGQAVFAVSPMNGPEAPVHPVAKDLEEFLRLVLACGGTAALEQAHQWSQARFDAFLQEDAPDAARQEALDALAEFFHLTPMEQPWAVLRELQSGFDYDSIPWKAAFARERAGLLSPAPRALAQLPQWKVRWQGSRGAGREIPIGKSFPWGTEQVHVPVAYAFARGLVLFLCLEVDPARIPEEPEEEETPEDRARREFANPLCLDFRPEIAVDGRRIPAARGSGSCWVPAERLPEGCAPEDEAFALVAHFSLDRRRGWLLYRWDFPWPEGPRPRVNSLSLTLREQPRPLPCLRFAVEGPGGSFPFRHPVTGGEHRLAVESFQPRTLNLAHLAQTGLELPTHCTAMTWRVEPPLPRRTLQLQDCTESDPPRQMAPASPAPGGTSAAAIGVIGGADGPTAVFFAGSGGEGETLSALHFQPVARVEWLLSVKASTRPEGTWPLIETDDAR